MIKGKRGITFNAIPIIIFAFVGIIILAILGFVFNSMYSGLNQDVMAGQVNMSNATEQTFGTFNTAFNNNLDLFGLFLIFGMIGGLLMASFLMRGKWDKLLIVVDLILMIAVYITAVLISNTYETLLNASVGVISQFEGSMPKSSNFLLHLPRYVVVIGAVSMILFYSGIPKRESEQSINYQEGEY